MRDTLIHHTKKITNDLSGKRTWELAVSLIDEQNESQYATMDAFEHASHGNLMTLLIDEQNGAFRWVYDLSRISKEEVDCISTRLLILLASARKDDR